jgi:hypothetical protein
MAIGSPPQTSSATLAVARNATRTKLLRDPAWLIEQNPDNTERRLYEVRDAAWKILQEWKSPVTSSPNHPGTAAYEFENQWPLKTSFWPKYALVL